MGAGNTIALIKALAKVDPETIQDSVNDWLDDHPEATTTVEDGSITKAKLDNSLQATVDDVSDLKIAFGVSSVSPELTTYPGRVINDGTITGTGSGANWKYADYVDISTAVDKFLTIRSTLYGESGTAWYDKNKNFIGALTGTNASDYGLVSQSTPQTYSLFLPSNAKYIRISGYLPEITTSNDLLISFQELNRPVNSRQGELNDGKSLIVGEDGLVTLSDIKLEDVAEDLYDFIGDPGAIIDAQVTVLADTIVIKRGDAVSSSGWECSDYVDISGAKNHTVTIMSTIYGTGATVWYDSAHGVIGGVDGSNASDYGITPSTNWQTYILTLPATAKYVRISGYTTFKTSGDALKVSYVPLETHGLIDEMLAEKVDIDQGIINAGKVMVVGNDGNLKTESKPWSSDIEPIETIVGKPEYPNLINEEDIVEDTYINSSGIRSASAYFDSSDFVLLYANTLYYVGNFYFNSTNPLNYMAFYSGAREADFISNPNVTITRDTDDHGTILVGSSDIYARLSSRKATPSDRYVSSIMDRYEEYSGPITVKEMIEQSQTSKACRFKKILVLGDSISTDAYGNYKKWVTDLIDEGYFPVGVNNNSQHATGFVARYDNQPNDFISRITAVANPETYDLVITFGGINDANQLIPMGEETDTDYTTYFGAAVRYYYKYLCTNFVNARIATLLPLPCSTQQREPAVIGVQYTYSDYQKSVAEAYSLPVLDLTNHSGFYPDANKPGIDYNAAQAFRFKWTLKVGNYDPDGIHPTAEYEKNFLAPMIKAFIDTL